MHTDWQFFLKSDDAWTAMKDACRDAQKEILCEQYILSNDEAGKEFIEILTEKARSGVGVQVILDMVGSALYGFYFDETLISKMRDAGVQLVFWNPIKFFRVDTFFSWFFRDHRKLMVVDGLHGFVGGVGFRADMREWRDTHLKVAGPVVEEMRHAFFEMWALAHEKRFFRRLHKRKFFSRGFQFVTNSPSLHKRFLYNTIIYELAAAKERVLLTTPYFIPDRKMMRQLRLAALRGARVEILVPKKSNHPWVDRASRSAWGKLLKSGAHIYAYEGNMIHAKSLVVDDAFATVGSFNFDSLSFNFNYEANVVSHQPLFVDQVAAYFEEDRSKASHIALHEWKKRSLREKVGEILIAPFRRLL